MTSRARKALDGLKKFCEGHSEIPITAHGLDREFAAITEELELLERMTEIGRRHWVDMGDGDGYWQKHITAIISAKMKAEEELREERE